jgi:polyhydroxyalkanoate synthesis regulator phasin
VSTSGPDEKGGEGSGISESLRSAIESTYAATVGSAEGGKERVSELLDDVTRRGREAREEVVRRGQEAREEVRRRGQEARQEVVRRGQEGAAEVVGRLEEELRTVSERLAKLESTLRTEQDKQGESS